MPALTHDLYNLTPLRFQRWKTINFVPVTIAFNGHAVGWTRCGGRNDI